MLEKLGIELIEFDLPFRLNHVNCLMAESDKGWAIIDTGLNDRRTAIKWKDLLNNKAISDLYISHYHPDHFGYSGKLQQITGARVSMTKVDEMSGITVWEENFIEIIRKNYISYGVPDGIAYRMTENTESFLELIKPYPTVNHYFLEEEKVPFGQYEYEVIYTPGHSDGLVTFYNKEESVLLSTDHILPRITPNIAYWFHGLKNPLKEYFKSLEKIMKLDIGYVIPSHGKPFFHANQRIDEIIKHHDNRLNFVLNQITEGETAYSLSNKLFNFEMDNHEKRFALGETIAHLEYLNSKESITKENYNGVWFYSKL